MDMRDVIHQVVKHHGIFGAAGSYYDAFSGAAEVRLNESLANKMVRPPLFAQVAQAAFRDRGVRSRMDRSSPENAGLIFAESVTKMLGSSNDELCTHMRPSASHRYPVLFTLAAGSSREVHILADCIDSCQNV